MHPDPRTLLADDLTGALDTAVRFASGADRRVFCAWDPAAIPQVPRDAVLVYDTETRNADDTAAGSAVTKAVRALAAAGRTPDYLKIDSTLRGPILATVAAVMAESAPPGVLICPALPEQGRVVVDGHVSVHGVRLQDTDLGSDPLAPADASFRTRLQTRWGAAAVAYGDVPALRQGLKRSARVLFADARSDPDLRRLIRLATEYRLLPVGSAGLAAAWAAARDDEGHTRPAAPPVVLPRPLAFVGGSPAARSRAQTAALAAACARLVVIHPERDGLVADAHNPLRARVLHATRQALSRALAGGQDVLLDLVHLPKEQILAAEGSAAQARENAVRIMAALASWVDALASAGTLVMLGGDTAFSALRAAGAMAIEVLGSALPQIPYGRVHGGHWHGRLLVTKAGGFGDEDALIRLRACDA